MVIGAGALMRVPASALQEAPTATPAQLQFPNASPSPPPVDAGPEAAETATRTPTPPGPAYAEPIDEANVRSGPGLDFTRLGTIYNGDRYVVIGAHRDYPWYQIEFNDSPSGVAWVYRDLVTLSGNVHNVPIIEGPEAPTSDPAQASVQQTLAVLEQTPGALGTATALAALLPTGVFEAEGEAAVQATRPPTFTPPPLAPTLPPAAFSPGAGQVDTGASGLPPAIPIIGLAAVGLLGLMVSAARRLF
ncbi:MAG: hypothetical protein Kow00120_27150 [Anaerolineae bacterium]